MDHPLRAQEVPWRTAIVTATATATATLPPAVLREVSVLVPVLVPGLGVVAAVVVLLAPALPLCMPGQGASAHPACGGPRVCQTSLQRRRKSGW